MKKLLFSVMFLVLASFSLATAGSLPKPEKFDEEDIITSERLGKYDTIIVKDFKTAGADLENMDDEEKKILDDSKEIIVKTLTESTVESLKKLNKFKKVEANGTAKGNAMVLQGKFYKFNAGHAAAKYFLGWMAPKSGKTSIGIEAELIDANTGKVLVKIKDIRAGGEGASMGSGRMAGAFMTQAKDEGEEIAEFIEKLY